MNHKLNLSIFLENRGEFVEKLQRARAGVKNLNPQPILSNPGLTKLTVGNWSLISKRYVVTSHIVIFLDVFNNSIYDYYLQRT